MIHVFRKLDDRCFSRHDYPEKCEKTISTDTTVGESEFARLPDVGRCISCAAYLQVKGRGYHETIFHALCPVGRHLTTVCGKSVGINEIPLREFRMLPSERKCTECVKLVSSSFK